MASRRLSRSGQDFRQSQANLRDRADWRDLRGFGVSFGYGGLECAVDSVVSYWPFPVWLGTILLTGDALAAADGTLLDGVIVLMPKRPAVLGGVGGGGGQRFPDRGQRGCRAVALPIHRCGVAFVHLHQRAAAEHPGWGQRKPGPVTGAAIPHTLGPRWTSRGTCPENLDIFY